MRLSQSSRRWSTEPLQGPAGETGERALARLLISVTHCHHLTPWEHSSLLLHQPQLPRHRVAPCTSSNPPPRLLRHHLPQAARCTTTNSRPLPSTPHEDRSTQSTTCLPSLRHPPRVRRWPSRSSAQCRPSPEPRPRPPPPRARARPPPRPWPAPSHTARPTRPTQRPPLRPTRPSSGSTRARSSSTTPSCAKGGRRPRRASR